MSEHPSAGIEQGQSYVTSLINAVMRSPQWNSTAIFLAWDDWGGFYDHVVPPVVDGQGYGIRVPAMSDQPVREEGHYIDHQTLSFDAYLKFIEDRFLGGQRLDPATDGRPDPRPDVRENQAILGDLANEFDFSQSPRQADDPADPSSHHAHGHRAVPSEQAVGEGRAARAGDAALAAPGPGRRRRRFSHHGMGDPAVRPQASRGR